LQKPIFGILRKQKKSNHGVQSQMDIDAMRARILDIGLMIALPDRI
jgi:hypothetical protein